ncbi:protein SHQ1 homolog [Polymixia lowei]
MITPAFELTQDPQYLLLTARVPYTRTSQFDIYIDGTDFKFYAKPYFLRLTLPGRIVEDGREKATFDIDKGLFTLRVPKETAGEHFEGLQMLTSLLAPTGSRSAKPLVEDISMEACGRAVGDDEEEDEEDFDWQVEQEVFMEITEGELGSLQKYGFGNQRSGVFARLQEELSDVIDIKDPEGSTAAQRRQARLEAEVAAFSHDHYLLDLFEDNIIRGLLKFCPWWAAVSSSSDQEGEEAFTATEKEQLRRFNNRSYLLDKSTRRQVWLSLVDVLLAYAYEVRFTEGEHNVESPWTIRKLSGTLCWLETYSSLQDVLVSFGRRVLCYPLYRHFDLVSAAVRDTALILQSGKACVLKCLLDIHNIFRQNDLAYILNDLYITDYCIWIQRVKSRKVTALAGPLRKISLQKKDLELELEELEEAAAMVVEEEEEEEEEREQGTSSNAPESRGVGSSESGSSSSDSSDESEDSETEGQGCAPCTEEGGGGRGGEMAKANPLQLQPTSLPSPAPARSPIPQCPPAALASTDRKPDPLPPSANSSQLIREPGEQVAAERRSSRPQPRDGNSGISATKAETNGSQPSTTAAQTGFKPEGSSTRTFLELGPRENPLLIVNTHEDLDEDDYIS